MEENYIDVVAIHGFGHDSSSWGRDKRAPTFGLYECISDRRATCLLEAERHTDLEMAMGSNSDGYRSEIEGGKAYDCILYGSVNAHNSSKASCIEGQKAEGPTCSTIPYPSHYLSMYARAKPLVPLEGSPPAISYDSSHCSDTWFWIGGRIASNPSALDEGCRRYQNVTVFTVNVKDPDLIVVDFGFEHVRAEGHAHYCTHSEHPKAIGTCDAWKRHEREHEVVYRCMPFGAVEDTGSGPECAFCGILNPDQSHRLKHNAITCPGAGISDGGRHDASLAASPALICLEAGPWQQIRCVGDCCDSKACPAGRLGKLLGLDSTVLNNMDMGKKDISTRREAFKNHFSALQKTRMASTARAKVGNKEEKQVTQPYELLMDTSVQLKELDRRAGRKCILNKPGARCQQILRHINPAHRVQSMFEVYKSANDVRGHNLIREKTLQTLGLTHTQPCKKVHLLDCGLTSRDSYRPNLLIDTACLFFGAIAGPPIQWVTLRSMHSGSNSLLDQKILQVLPFSAKLVAALESHQTIAMALMFASTSMSVALLCKVAATTAGSARSAVFICFWLAMVIGASAWNTLGGSAAEFFPVFLPVATTVGAISGLLWRCR